MIKNYIQTERTARYFQSKEMDDKVKHVVFVLHGYAQNGDDFLKSFELLNKPEILLVAPEGLSKFYWKDFSSNPSSSWMTSLERENEISDTLIYLNKVVKAFVVESLDEGIQFHVLGFSQGCATASRFLAQSPFTFINLFLYAGNYAHDIDWKQFEKQQSDLNFHLIYGTEDMFISKTKVEEAESFLLNENFNVDTFSFKGKHKIVEEATSYILSVVLNK